MKKAFLLISVFALISSIVAASSLAEVKERKKLVILSYPHPLSSFVKMTDSGQYEGLDVTIMKTLSNSLGVSLVVRPVEKFQDLIPQLLAGEGDVIASSFSITKDREKLVDFSKPYFPVVVMVVTRKDASIAKVQDLKGLKGSVVSGSSQQERMNKVPDIRFHFVESSTLHYEMVKKGEADFAFLDSTSALTNIEKYPELKIAFQLPEVEYYGYAVKPGSDLLVPINEHIDRLKQTGLLYQITRRSMGDKASELLNLIQGVPK